MDQKRKDALARISAGIRSGQDVESILQQPENPVRKSSNKKTNMKPVSITLGPDELAVIKRITDLLWEKESITNPKLSRVIRAVLKRIEIDDRLVEAYKEG